MDGSDERILMELMLTSGRDYEELVASISRRSLDRVRIYQTYVSPIGSLLLRHLMARISFSVAKYSGFGNNEVEFDDHFLEMKPIEKRKRAKRIKFNDDGTAIDPNEDAIAAFVARTKFAAGARGLSKK